MTVNKNVESCEIQRVLNASARLVCNALRFCHITPIMRDLHWLPIRARINFKVLLLTFKELHGLAPQYLQSLISVKTSCYNLRGSNTLLLAMPSVKLPLQRHHCGILCLVSFAQLHAYT